ncbi:hypothetical protein [Janthinobacterium sp.]|uniref:hypothetical protein n=1 Tax=Janthinobacterium sp. TaxID=1871054 RepID=UPI00338E19AD
MLAVHGGAPARFVERAAHGVHGGWHVVDGEDGGHAVGNFIQARIAHVIQQRRFAGRHFQQGQGGAGRTRLGWRCLGETVLQPRVQLVEAGCQAGRIEAGGHGQQALHGRFRRLAPVAVAAHAIEHGSTHMAGRPARHLAVERHLPRQADGVAAGIDQQEVILVFAPRQRAGAHAGAGGSIEPGAEVELVFD